MADGILSLRKLQIKALRSQVQSLPPQRALRILIHEVIRLHERLYRQEAYEDTVRIAVAGDPSALIDRVAVAFEDEMRCSRCGKQVQLFRTKKEMGIYYTLGLCQACQDEGPTSLLAPPRTP